MKPLLALAFTLLLAACGGRSALEPKAGNTLPVKPETAAVLPTPQDLLTPDIQSRPGRSDEQLKRSEERKDDKFDLPPAG